MSKYSETYRLSGGITGSTRTRTWLALRVRTFLEVLEAFDALVAGAFKADLFRYCVLFIHGGVYADVDMRLVSDLDVSVPPDTGFMVAFDNVSTTRMRLKYMASNLSSVEVHGFKFAF
jgi:mannosyltransferase OCH1-like enzyme